MLVVDLGKWMNKILIDWGIDAKVADRFDETIIAILMIAIAVGVDYLCQAILVGGMRQYTRRKPHLWNTLLMKRKVFHNLIHRLPGTGNKKRRNLKLLRLIFSQTALP